MSEHHGMAKALRERQQAQASIHDRTFGRLFERNPIRLPTDLDRALDLLSDLADAMRDEASATGPADAGQTFFGQFVDHDVTLDVQSALGKTAAAVDIENQRTPTLDLDCVLGGGAEASPLLYSHHSHETAHYLLTGTHANPDDLARNPEGIACIGDPRNDENAFVAAVQNLMIRFHNVLLHRLRHDTDGMKAAKLKDESDHVAAARLLRWHYHWIILHEYLPAFVDDGVLERVVRRMERGRLPKGMRPRDAYIPAEFSVAAYRFGHGTVRSEYDIGTETVKLFANDGSMDGLPAFGPKTRTVDLAKFFGTRADPDRAQKARPVGPRIAAELYDLPFVGGGEDGPPAISFERARSLAHRNLIRDRFGFELASGQQAAAELGFTPLDRDEPTRRAGLDKIPLWYYCLQEGDHYGGKLGETGGTIVAGVICRLLRDDPRSLWHADGFAPLFARHGAFGMGDVVDLVNEAWGEIPFGEVLRSPRSTDFASLS